MPERERADRVEVPRLRRPELVEAVAALFESEDALGVVRELAYEDDRETVVRGWRPRAVSEGCVNRALIDSVSNGRLENEWLRNLVAGSIWIQTARGSLLDDLVPLKWVVDPLARNLARRDEGTVPAQLRPVHSIEVVRRRLTPLDPALFGTPVHHLDKLERTAFDMPGRIFGRVMANAG